MHKYSLSLRVLILLVAAFICAPTNYAQGRGALAEADRGSGDRFMVDGRTPRGAQVYAVKPPSGAMLNAIDQGLSDLFAVARKNGYNRGLNYSNFTVFIGRADRTKDSAGQYSPDIAVGAAQYAGSVYDQGGYIYAAGMVISPGAGAFLIAEHTKNMNRVADVVRYEGEHIVLYNNDRRRFQATLDHSQGGGHPILQ